MFEGVAVQTGGGRAATVTGSNVYSQLLKSTTLILYTPAVGISIIGEP